MPTTILENKWTEYSASEGYDSLNDLAMLEETVNMVLQLRKSATSNDPVVNIVQEHKLPDFYELKIRVRKYDFL